MSRLLAQFNIINPVIHSNLGTDPTRGPSTLQSLLRSLISIGIGVGIILFFIQLLRGGLEYIMAGSDKEALFKANGHIKNATIGLIILVSIYVIAWTIGTLLGINLIQLSIPTLA